MAKETTGYSIEEARSTKKTSLLNYFFGEIKDKTPTTTKNNAIENSKPDLTEPVEVKETSNANLAKPVEIEETQDKPVQNQDNVFKSFYYPEPLQQKITAFDLAKQLLYTAINGHESFGIASVCENGKLNKEKEASILDILTSMINDYCQNLLYLDLDKAVQQPVSGKLCHMLNTHMSYQPKGIGMFKDKTHIHFNQSLKEINNGDFSKEVSSVISSLPSAPRYSL